VAAEGSLTVTTLLRPLIRKEQVMRAFCCDFKTASAREATEATLPWESGGRRGRTNKR